MREHTIQPEGFWHNWLFGTVDGIAFEAKICDVPSAPGIDDGRVFKLVFYAPNSDQEILIYDRGWDIYPAAEYEDALDALLAYCARLPNANDWQFQQGENF